MRILSLGDIHGRDYWKFITHGSPYDFDIWQTAIYNGAKPTDFPEMDYNKYDKIVFVGDYVDSYDINDVLIKKNLEDIIFFARNCSFVNLLLGNHDIAYILPNQWCEGHRPAMHHDLYKIFTDNRDLFNFAYQEKNFLWTHAGVTTEWYNVLLSELSDPSFRYKTFIDDLNLNEMSISDVINTAWKFNASSLHDNDYMSGGSYEWAGPTWVRPSILRQFAIENQNQIIGHTPSDDIIIINSNKNTNLYRIDCLYETLKCIVIDI